MSKQKGVWIPEPILALTVLSITERLLLAQVCYRAVQNKGICSDTNAQLAAVLYIHVRTVSSSLSLLAGCGLLEPIYGPRRSYRPVAALLALYERPKQH